MFHVFDTLDLIIGTVEHTQVKKWFETFDFGQSVIAYVELFELWTSFEVFDFCDSIRLQADYDQIGQVKILNLSDLVFSQVPFLKWAYFRVILESYF